MRRSPFKDPSPLEADLDATQGVVMAGGEGAACSTYREVGLRLLGDRTGVPLVDFLEELRAEHEGHWLLGLESLGWRGYSRDVSRTHALNTGHSLWTQL